MDILVTVLASNKGMPAYAKLKLLGVSVDTEFIVTMLCNSKLLRLVTILPMFWNRCWPITRMSYLRRLLGIRPARHSRSLKEKHPSAARFQKKSRNASECNVTIT